jgi:hypothetical protein
MTVAPLVMVVKAVIQQVGNQSKHNSHGLRAATNKILAIANDGAQYGTQMPSLIDAVVLALSQAVGLLGRMDGGKVIQFHGNAPV